ncbi:MAG TPA: KAP family NTPase [Puia sp.]|jgi:hypothetical protein|nr:KAP family NTPase [Puia sp.]
MENIQLDAPVNIKSEDHFQRYEFSRRIATLINGANFSRSLVIGIYGKWGEGKSSVLNFVSLEISTNSIQIKFNPWYFQDDKQLVKSFFENIASALGKKLASKKDQILQVFADYSESVGAIAGKFMPNGLSALLGAGKKLALTFKKDSLDYYKNRVQELIDEANCNFVIFIDDIDRLNITEIQSIFRLVKLLGDFPRFTYVLAFDDELVAASLGHQYGGKDREDGYGFLEKIIQLPLTLPKADPFALRKYSLDLVNATLSQLGVELKREELQKFLGKYDSAFVPYLKSPRLAVRLANAIAFAIPLLLGEVSLDDLMIMEGIKVFYPETYYFIRDNAGIFLSRYQDHNVFGNEEKGKAKASIENHLDCYEDALRKSLREMLCSLFPQLNGLYNNFLSGQIILDSWYRERRICSPYYYLRYFSYAVKSGDISDVYFDQLFADADKMDPADFFRQLSIDIERIGVPEFIFKLSMRVDGFSLSAAQTLYRSLSMIGKLLPDQTGIQLYTPKDDMAKIIRQLIGKLDPERRVDYCLDSLDLSNPLNFTLALYQRFADKRYAIPDEMFLAPEKAVRLGNAVIERFLEYNRKIHLFDTLTDVDLITIVGIYDAVNRVSDISEVLDFEVRHDPTFTLRLIKIFTPTIFVAGKEGAYKAVFSEEDYTYMSRFVDTAAIYGRLVKAFGRVSVPVGKEAARGEMATDMELVGLFERIHELRIGGENQINKA